MSILFLIHPDWDEMSKISHILSGRNFAIHKFDDIEPAVHMLERIAPDICLVAYEILGNTNSFRKTLNEKITDCPLIALTNKIDISKSIELVSNKDIYDYFLLHPIVDPARLHVIIDKALVDSTVKLNLQGLKQKLAGIPDDVSESMGLHSKNLSEEIGKVLDNFKERIKSHEFNQIIKLLDEKAFDEKLEELKKVEVEEVIFKTHQDSKYFLKDKLTKITSGIEHHIDNPPSIDMLPEVRAKLSSGFYFGSSNLVEQAQSKHVDNLKQSQTEYQTIRHGVSDSTLKILVMQDSNYPTPELANVLRDSGYDVLEAHSTRKFLHMAKEQQVDIIIIGYHTTDTNGIAVMENLNKTINRSVPSILLSVDVETEILRQAKSAGFTRIVRLPFRHGSIVQTIKEVTGKNPV